MSNITKTIDPLPRNAVDDGVRPINHDLLYVQYLQRAFGTTSAPFYGALLCAFAVIVFVFIAIVVSFMSSPITQAVDSVNTAADVPYREPIVVLN